MAISPDYAELHCISNFTFLRGASHPEELVERAHALGYKALALTDECSVAGCVRAHSKAKQLGLKLIIGAEFTLACGIRLVVLAPDRVSYGALCTLISKARGETAKGKYRIERKDFETISPESSLAVWLPETREGLPHACNVRNDDSENISQGRWLKRIFPERLWIAAELLLDGQDTKQLAALKKLGNELGVRLCAAGDVHMHHSSRRPLQDTLTAIRLGKPVAELGHFIFQNGERYLRSRNKLARIYPPDFLAQTTGISERCRFSLDELRYEYPQELIPPGHTAYSWLKQLTEEGMRKRWENNVREKEKQQIGHELSLIRELAYEPYFLTVCDLVHFARSRGILCQGRGSAANSVVCYCLGITEVNPEQTEVLFERFISRERSEPPDIDVDFEHERREEVIQYIYQKYGRQRAALAAAVITYKSRSAVRDVGKALGLDPTRLDALSRSHYWWDGDALPRENLAAAGLNPESALAQNFQSLVRTLIGFPRHLSQHVGGFVISRGPLHQLVPIENAAMQDRTVIQWDKNDLETLGLLKVDVLALGMLSAIRRALAYISDAKGCHFGMQDVPRENPDVYDMLCKADSIGVFQVESRAQMSMLPRLKPRNYYDLVVQIAIVRPGPIQGDMVHPYLARRSDKSKVDYPSEAVRSVLARTLGVPIFQEQVMQLAMVAAGFSAGEADQLRRAMAAWHRRGGLEPFEKRLLDGMRERGYTEQFSRQIFNQIKGFGEYGFPESHSASFALLAYVSAWIKCHYPAQFLCALLNSQPMGFYQPSQLVQDAQRHGVEMRPVEANASKAECSLEPPDAAIAAVRLGFNQVRGLSKNGVAALLEARVRGPYANVNELATRSGISKKDLEALAAVDAFSGLAGHRHRAFWQATGTEKPLPLLNPVEIAEAEPMLQPPTEGKSIAADYISTGLSLRRHPLALLRPEFRRRGLKTASEIQGLRHGVLARFAGLVLSRQRPGSATGVIFVTLEDETGHINAIVWQKHADMQRRALLESRLLSISGTVQRGEGDVLHLLAGRLEDLSAWLGKLSVASRDFH